MEMETEIDIEIDELTNCLVDRSNGNTLDTEYRLVVKTISKEDANRLNEQGGNLIGASHIKMDMKCMS